MSVLGSSSDLCFHLVTWVCVHQQIEAQAAEAQKERKLRERNEQYSRQLEEELEGLKVSLKAHTAQREPVWWCYTADILTF